ncbi:MULTISPECIES: diguanylate cyclase domain-containing protein [Actinosynnema]|uniref:diguanylate cyclase domain-containing protein n=1 Tax=Actinosynnema TaxID=40566 RepID=UPI0020A2551B|nr:diguanylate cyclase [Actinosynnema pretiosum]MCP2099985.1 PAS domain S-box-containing protein/diguanylate cyclase (GGDEF) domain-containing protein [Actinosynnema pretiosum]
MTVPLSREAEALRERAELAGTWAGLLAGHSGGRVPGQVLERALLGEVERLCAGALGIGDADEDDFEDDDRDGAGPGAAPGSPDLAVAAGRTTGGVLAELTEDPEALRVSLELLSAELPALSTVAAVGSRVPSVLAALAAGFAEQAVANAAARSARAAKPRRDSVPLATPRGPAVRVPVDGPPAAPAAPAAPEDEDDADREPHHCSPAADDDVDDLHDTGTDERPTGARTDPGKPDRHRVDTRAPVAGPAPGGADLPGDPVAEPQVAESVLLAAKAGIVEEAARIGVASVTFEGSVLEANDALADILNRARGTLTGVDLLELVHPADRGAVVSDLASLACGGTSALSGQRRLVRPDGEVAWAALTTAPLRPPGRTPYAVVVVEDRTDVSLLQGQLNHQSLHDVLTWLPNRQYFTSRLERALRTADPATGITVYHLDLDGFSRINGGLGRVVGDHVLKTAASRLFEVAPGENSMIARFGADEFAVLVENVAGTPDVVTTVRRINERLGEPLEVAGQEIALSATIGVVHRPAPGTPPAELLEAADLALRRARGLGSRQWALADPELDAVDRRDFTLAATMPGAWRRGELEVRYRPVVRLADSEVVAAEAVLRWRHPVLGVLPHERCARLAEETGFAVPLGALVLRAACERAVEWARDGAELPVRVALSGEQAADQDLVGSALRVLEETGLPRRLLRVAVPARVLFERDEAADNLRVLADAGVGAEVDDFPVGPGELAALEGFPVRAVRVRAGVEVAHPSAVKALGPVLKAR